MDAKEIALDVSKTPSESRVVCTDDTILTVHVLDHGKPLDIGDLSASLLMRFQDGKSYKLAGAVDGSAAAFEVNASAMKGGCTDNAYVSLSGDDFVLSTSRFHFEVSA